MKTILNDRILWYDGTCEVNPDHVPSLLLHGVEPSKIVVDSSNADIKLFNQLSMDEFIAEGKAQNNSISMKWVVPEEYLKLDLDNFVLATAVALGEKYVERAKQELEEIKSRNLTVIFNTLIYVLDVLRVRKQVWGVGRGSSCASLVLFIIGVHEVDPVKYNIPASEFFHD